MVVKVQNFLQRMIQSKINDNKEKKMTDVVTRYYYVAVLCFVVAIKWLINRFNSGCHMSVQ